MSDLMKEIIGKKIVRVRVGGYAGIGFVTDTGEEHYYEPEPSCCESLSLEHISGIEYLIGQTVVSVESRGYNEGGNPGADDCIDDAFFQIVTDKGLFDFEGRNQHNGYYGGFYWKPVSEFHKREWEDVTQDF